MKTLVLLICLLGAFQAEAQPEQRQTPDSLSILQRQVVHLFKKTAVPFPDIPEQDVTIGFLINARNEVIVTDVDGDSDAACDYVKEVLNYQRVKFFQPRQLTRYEIKVRLVNEFDKI